MPFQDFQLPLCHFQLWMPQPALTWACSLASAKPVKWCERLTEWTLDISNIYILWRHQAFFGNQK